MVCLYVELVYIIYDGMKRCIMEQKQLKYLNGVYYTDIDITTDEWKEMLVNDDIFTVDSLKMLNYWYEQTDYMATSKEIMDKYQLNYKSSPFNGTVIGLGKRIIKYLNRFEVIGTDGNKSYFILPFEGWHENFSSSGRFVWKIRSELVQAIEELKLFEDVTETYDDDLQNIGIIEKRADGKVKVSYTTKYERDKRNRRLAIKLHGTKCEICGFDFEKIYGERGKGFIEVHHIKPLYENQKEIIITPEKDLICVCSNCHRMFHRKKDRVPTPKELKKELERLKNSVNT